MNLNRWKAVAVGVLFVMHALCVQSFAQVEIEKYDNVAVIQIKTEFELDDSFKVTAKSMTCQPKSIAPGVFVINTPGQHLLDVDVLSFKKEVWESQLVEVVVGDVKPTPPKPDEPDIEPDEPDEPDNPTPDEPDAPQTLTNMKVLFVVESETQAQLPTSQAAVLFAKKVRDYLKANGVDWLRIDPDSELGASHPFKNLAERPRGSMPWMVFAGDEGIGLEEPLSPNVEAFLRTVDQYVAPRQIKAVQRSPMYTRKRVPRLVTRSVPKQRCRIINGRQICETYYENVIETIYETKYVEVSQ